MSKTVLDKLAGPTVPRSYAEELAAALDEHAARLEAIRRLHQPRSYGRPAYTGSTTVVRCQTCAVSRNRDLRRVNWPCPTAEAGGWA